MELKMLLFDLDGTLLQSDKTISQSTLKALQKYRERGILIGVSTSRSEKNSLKFIAELSPDIIISSGGALVKYSDRYIYKAEFTSEETVAMIKAARDICSSDCEITIDTVDEHYWNYKEDPNKLDPSWGESIYTDFEDFHKNALKMCVEIFDPDKAKQLADILKECDCVKFVDGEWYKFTKKTATKEEAIVRMCENCEILTENIMAFGDDLVDIGMLKLCGMGVAMGNALEAVKKAADVVIGSNDEEGIGRYLEDFLERIN